MSCMRDSHHSTAYLILVDAAFCSCHLPTSSRSKFSVRVQRNRKVDMRNHACKCMDMPPTCSAHPGLLDRITGAWGRVRLRSECASDKHAREEHSCSRTDAQKGIELSQWGASANPIRSSQKNVEHRAGTVQFPKKSQNAAAHHPADRGGHTGEAQ